MHPYYRFTKSSEGGESMVSTWFVFGYSCGSAAGNKEQAHQPEKACKKNDHSLDGERDHFMGKIGPGSG